MTQERIIASSGDTLGGSPAFFRLEAVQTLKLALPMALTQLGQVAMFTTDLALLGRLGGKAIAAVALAHTVFFAAFVVGLGLISAVSPMVAHSFGAREPRLVRRAVRAGLWASVLVGLPLTVALQWGSSLLLSLGQQPDAARDAGVYLLGLAFSLVPAWVFMVLRNFMGAVNRPEPALWITLAAIPINGCLAYALIFGAFDLPRLGLLGAGIATTLTSSAMCIAAFFACYTLRPFRKYWVLGRFWRFDGPLFLKLLQIGLPISAQFLLEFGVFAAAAFLMGKIGTIALAAHQIAIQVAAILFMVPLGISMAATVRVGHAIGRNDSQAARRAGIAAIVLGVAFMALMTAIVAATRQLIPAVFVAEDSPLGPETIALASELLLLGMTFFIADGAQGVAAGALRGLNDTRVPLAFAFVSFWIVGFLASYGFAFVTGLGAAGIWIGLTLGLILYAVLLVGRFLILTRAGKPSRIVRSSARLTDRRQTQLN
jgi:MATE family multidrug resistance protein